MKKTERGTARKAKGSHPTVRISHGGQAADVDKAIAPLVLEMWRAGIWTRNSCQGNNDPWFRRGSKPWAYVQFARVHDARRFLSLVTKFQPGGRSLYNRMTGMGCRGIRAWYYDIGVRDDAYDWDLGRTTGAVDIHFTVAIYFPRSDVRTLAARLRGRNAATGSSRS